MSKGSAVLAALAIGGGILLQIPSRGGHAEHHAADGHGHAPAAAAAAVSAPATHPGAHPAEHPGARTVTLAVSGMT